MSDFSLLYINQPNNFGSQINDPRYASKSTFTWTINVNSTMPPNWSNPEDQIVALEIVGIPPVAPVSGDTYELAIIFKRTAVRNPTPFVDAVRVKWIVGNGPMAIVTTTDTYSNIGSTFYDLEP